MVEPQIVILVVAGSSPVDHPTFSIGISYGVLDGRGGTLQIIVLMQPLESRIHTNFATRFCWPRR